MLNINCFIAFLDPAKKSCKEIFFFYKWENVLSGILCCPRSHPFSKCRNSHWASISPYFSHCLYQVNPKPMIFAVILCWVLKQPGSHAIKVGKCWQYLKVLTFSQLKSKIILIVQVFLTLYEMVAGKYFYFLQCILSFWPFSIQSSGLEILISLRKESYGSNNKIYISLLELP